jgi:endoglucanase
MASRLTWAHQCWTCGVRRKVRTRAIRERAETLTAGVTIALVATLLAAWGPAQTARAAAAPPPSLTVQGNQLVDSSGAPITLRGVDRSGTEYQCVHGVGIFDPTTLDTLDQAGTDAWIQPITAWHRINAVRVPLNEDCWLGINRVKPAYAGTTYQHAIARFVQGLYDNGLVAILDLHWSAPGSKQATGQQPMPDRDHSLAFWQSVAATFANDPWVVFDLFNEPFPNSNQDTAAAWQCWKSATTCSGFRYSAVGMQDLVNTVRGIERGFQWAGASNVIMLGGIQYANSLSHWLGSNTPTDPDNKLVASWHVYDFNPCNTVTCWDATVAPVAQTVPIVTGEFGEKNQGPSFVTGLLPWLDQHGISYVGWTWDAWNSWDSLITDYNGTPNSGLYNGVQAYGGAYHTYLAGLP